MSEYLSFYFNINDPKFKTYEVILNEYNFISHAFISSPIYDDFGVEIGYKVSDDYIQEVDEHKYMVRINSTYYIKDKGTITWQYSFINNKPSFYYPINELANSNIVSTTGAYFGKKGVVSLNPTKDGKRQVTVAFNF